MRIRVYTSALMLLFAFAAGCIGTGAKQTQQGTPPATSLPAIETPPRYDFEDFLAVKQVILESGEKIDATHVKHVVKYGERYVQQDYRLKAYFPDNASKPAALGITYLRLESEAPPPPVPEELKDKIMEGNLSQGLRAFFFQMRGAVAYPDGRIVRIKRVYVPEKGEVELEEKIFQKDAEAMPIDSLIKK